MAQQQHGDREKKREANVDTVEKMIQRMRTELLNVLPKTIPVDRFARICLTTIRRNDMLRDCSPASVVGALMLAAQDGLEVDGVGAALVPYWSSEVGGFEAQYQPMYRGLMSLARRSGAIVAIEAELVYKGDVFYQEKGLTPKLKHLPKYETTKDDDVEYAYSIATLKDGRRFAHVMPRSEILKHRDRSRSYARALEKKRTDSTWHTDFPPMALKTVIRDHIKYLPTPSDLQRIVEYDEARETGRLPATVPIGELMPAQCFDTVPENLGQADQRETTPAAAQARPGPQEAPRTSVGREKPPAAPTAAAPTTTKTPRAVFKAAMAWFGEQHDENPRLAATALFRSVAEHASPEEYTPAELTKVLEKLGQAKEELYRGRAAPLQGPPAAAAPEAVDDRFIGDPPKKDAVVEPPSPAPAAVPQPAPPAPAPAAAKADGAVDLFPDEPEAPAAAAEPAPPDFVPPGEMEPILSILHQWCGEVGVTTPKNQDVVIDAYFKEMGFEDGMHVPRDYVEKMKRSSDTESVFKMVVKVLFSDAPKGKAKK